MQAGGYVDISMHELFMKQLLIQLVLIICGIGRWCQVSQDCLVRDIGWHKLVCVSSIEHTLRQ